MVGETSIIAERHCAATFERRQKEEIPAVCTVATLPACLPECLASMADHSFGPGARGVVGGVGKAWYPLFAALAACDPLIETAVFFASRALFLP